MNRRAFIFLTATALLGASTALAYQKAAGHFGAAFTDAKVVALGEVMAHVEKYANRPVKVEGEIKDVCQAKGCWLVVTDGERAMRVTFKDYAFFVPKDAAGKKVVLEGLVEKKTISEMHAQHIAG